MNDIQPVKGALKLDIAIKYVVCLKLILLTLIKVIHH